MSQTSFPPTPAPERLLSVACPTCNATIAVDAALLGQAAECPLCASGFRLPAATSAAAPSRPSPSSAPAPRRGEAPVRSAGTAQAPARQPATKAWIAPELSDAVAHPDRDEESASLKRTSAERAARRARRNVMMLIVGGSILLGIVMLLGRSRR